MGQIVENKKDLDWNKLLGALAGVVLLVVLWSYWSMFVDLAEEWSKNPLYSHGYLVPLFAAFLLWWRRDQVPQAPIRPSWWAVLFLSLGAALRLGATYYYFAWPERASLLLMLIAVALALGGWAALRWSWPGILFLFFMIPLPGFVEGGLVRPLQRVSTIASTNVLQTLGFFAQADGNVIVLSNGDLGIVEACAGLGMLSIFIALTVGACFVIDRPLWQKVLIVASSIPIAVLCNVIRISATGSLYDVADHVTVHDVAGLLMPIFALVLLVLELKVLDFVYQLERPPQHTGSSQAAPALG